MLTPEEKQALIDEKTELELKANSGWCSPKEMRRIDEIQILLLTDGKYDNIKWKTKRNNSNRVTSFTPDRR